MSASVSKRLKFGFSGKSNFLENLSLKIGQWWYIFFSALGAIITSISSSLVSSYTLPQTVDFGWDLSTLFWLYEIIFSPWGFLIYGAILIFYGAKGTFIDLKNLNTENSKLKDENNSVEKLKSQINGLTEDSEQLQNKLVDLHAKLVTTWLKSTSHQLNLNTYDRVSIYFYLNSSFFILARHSENPKLAEIHRQKFSRNHGVISKAWEHRNCIDTENIPSFTNKPEEYYQYMSTNYGYNREKINALTMKSCQYIAIAISEAGHNIGVIVFESEQHSRFKYQKVAQIKKHCTDHQSYMSEFIREAIKHDKSAKIASRNSVKDVDKDFLEQFPEGDRNA